MSFCRAVCTIGPFQDAVELIFTKYEIEIGGERIRSVAARRLLTAQECVGLDPLDDPAPEIEAVARGICPTYRLGASHDLFLPALGQIPDLGNRLNSVCHLVPEILYALRKILRLLDSRSVKQILISQFPLWG